MIKTHNLTKKYGESFAIQAIELDLAAGDLFGFIGPNGAGKTTTMKILATLLDPTYGEAYVCGHSIYRDPKEIRRLVGYMPDFFGVYDDMKVIEYLEFFAAAYRINGSKRRQVCNEKLDLVDLDFKRDAYANTLSRGQTQRLGLARVLLARAAGAAARRAAVGARSAGADRDAGGAAAAGSAGQDDHGVEPHPARAGRHVQQGRDHRQRRDGRERHRGRVHEARCASGSCCTSR